MNQVIILGILIVTTFFCISFCFVIILIYQTIQKQRYTPHLLLGFVIILIGSLFQIITFFLDLFTYYSESKIIQGIVRIIFGLAMYFIYLHYEALSNITPSFYRRGLIISIISITFYILAFAIWQNIPIPDVEIFMFLFYSMVGLITISFAVFVTYKSYNLMHDKPTSFELIALIILLSTFLLQLCSALIRTLGFPFVNNDPNLLDTINIVDRIAEVLALAAVLILLTTYFYYKDYVYRLPVPVHDFLIYSSSGLLVYSRTVKIPGINLVFEKQLITGMFTAIASLIKETLGTNSKLEQINVNNYRIFFSEMPNKQGTLAVIAAKGTFFLKHSIQRFVLSITEELNQKINEPIVDIDDLAKELDLLLNQSFPYLVLN
ncbi:MAG: hypothetical protein ACW964_02665 [Candidatus Hodarchaeales archaeon]